MSGLASSSSDSQHFRLPKKFEANLVRVHAAIMGYNVKEDNNQLKWIDGGYQNKKGMIDRPVPKIYG